MSFKIAFIGAGSIGFTRKLTEDLLLVPELNDVELSFMDISERNLDMVSRLVRMDLDANGMSGLTFTATTDRAEALKDAKYVFSVVRIGGLEAFETDIEIPLKYGIDQCVGDTLSAGGIMYGQRNIAFILDLCRDIKTYARPDCLFLNYANPMAMNTWAAHTYGGVRTVGLCHGVQGGHELLADALGLAPCELDYSCVGINHQTWYVKLSHKGADMTGKILEALENHPVYSEQEKVRIDMLKRFGYFSTESNGHLSEYLPWYRKRHDEICSWVDMRKWIHGETGGYLRQCRENRNWFEEEFPKLAAEGAKTYKKEDRSSEHGSYIIEALETGRGYRGHFNVINGGAVANLDEDCVVEVPGYVDRNGLFPLDTGPLPPGPAAVCRRSILVQRLAVEAAVSGDAALLKQAMLMDPLTGAMCTPPEVWQLTDEMLIAGEQWLPQYKDAISDAKKRLANGLSLPRPFEGYRGAARKESAGTE
jgi:alpha-galactosidase